MAEQKSTHKQQDRKQCYIIAELQSWPKILGQIPELDTKYLPAPLPPCNVVKLLCLCTVQLISVAFNIAWGKEGLPNICNDGTAKLMATGYRYPEHKCTL